MHAVITISKKAAVKLINGCLWIYDNEIVKAEGEYENGDIIQIAEENGRILGLGFINEYSKIRIRLLTKNKNEVINREFFRKRLVHCWNYRKKVIDTSCCRIIFGEADFLPGLTVDKFNDVLVVQSLALGIDRYKEMILEELMLLLQKDGHNIRGVYERSDAKVRLLEGMELKTGFLFEPFDTNVIITENNIKYQVDIEQGQKTGYFLDQKLNRLAIHPFAKDKQVLDCFTHTGSFALNAAAAGAAKVTAIDISEHAISCARENASLNQLFNIDFLCDDVLDLLPRWLNEGKQFDLVILDPPAFTKSKRSVNGAMRGYREINRRGMKLIRDGGFLATCSCSRFMTEDLFSSVILQAALSCGKTLRQVEIRTQSPDHPILWGADESYYLKFFIFQVFSQY